MQAWLPCGRKTRQLLVRMPGHSARRSYIRSRSAGVFHPRWCHSSDTTSQSIKTMLSFPTTLTTLLLATAPAVQARLEHHHHKCPQSPGGDFTLNQYQLYPENAIWDPENCVIYFKYTPSTSPPTPSLTSTHQSSALFNGSISPFHSPAKSFPSPSHSAT